MYDQLALLQRLSGAQLAGLKYEEQQSMRVQVQMRRLILK